MSTIFLLLLWPAMPSGLIAQTSELPEFSMSKGMCYGSCPVFTLEIYKSRFMIYKGEKNTSKLGVYRKELSKSEYKEICKAFKKSKFDSFLDHYDSRVPDLPSVSLTYHKIGKTVTGKLERPQIIHELEELLTRYADSKNGWKFVEQLKVKSDNEENEQNNQIIILVDAKLDIQSWVKRYHQYNLKLVKRIAPNSHYWLLSFDLSKIPGGQMLSTLKTDPEVKDAQFNSKISPRN